MGTTHFPRMAFAVMAGAVGLSACGGEVSPTGSNMARPAPAFAVGDATTSTPEYGMIKLCKSASSNVSGTFTVTRVGNTGSTGTVLANPTIAPGVCVVVGEDNGGAGLGSTYTITETSVGLVSTAGRRIDKNQTTQQDVFTDSPFADGDSRFVNAFHGFTITYVNTIAVGGQGCSPGYWKNHNFPDGYTKGQLFSSVFDDAFADKTLQEVLSTGGGGLTALGRHTVSALLNAASLGSNYEYTTQEVIDKFNAVYPGGNYSGLAAEFAALQDVNGRICPNPTGR